MKRLLLGAGAALLLGTAVIVPTAHAACWWNGYGWVCDPPQGNLWNGGRNWCAWHPYRC